MIMSLSLVEQKKLNFLKKYYLLKLPILAQQKNAVQLRSISIISIFFILNCSRMELVEYFHSISK